MADLSPSAKLIAIYVQLLLCVFEVSGYSTGPNNNWNGGEYDFIVVGAGIGGCVVAARLAECGRYSVLLIEAGGVPHPDLEIPALSSTFIADPNYFSMYPSITQRTAGLAFNGTITFLNGRVLGGSTGINGLFLNRGNPYDYDNWAKLTGDQSWNYSNMLKYFRKYENYSGDYPSDQRGFFGPVTVSRPRYSPGLREWLAAGQELGYTIAEPNGPQITSFTQVDYTMKFGRRVSSYSGYIAPLLKTDFQPPASFSSSQSQSNLQIMINSQVNRIIFESGNAIGVRINRSEEDGRSSMLFARARKEIILAGGVAGTPILLQKSGVGPKALLEEAKIPLVKELPVGQNFQDHVMVLQAIIFGDRSATFNPEVDLNEQTYREYLITGDGPYTSYTGNGGQAYLEIPEGPIESGWPNVHIFFANAISNFTATLGAEGIDPNELEDGEVAVSWFTMITRPKSRGSITLNPKDVDGLPLIDFNFLSHPYDLRPLVEGIKMTVKICEETRAFQSIGCRISRIPLSSCSHLLFRSDSYWECYARWFGNTAFHGGGTCRMGSGVDAVVNTKLKVIGVNGLRVVDASIMPRVINANPQAAVYAIAEKGAEMILEEWP